MKHLVTLLSKDEFGATAIDYGLIAGQISVLIVTSLILLRPNLKSMHARNRPNYRAPAPGRRRSDEALPRRHPLTRFVGRLADFRSDKSGAVAIMAAVLMPFMVAGMGLGAETGYNFMKQRELQHAVDVAAHAGAVRLRAGDEQEEIEAAALHVATESGFNAARGTITVNSPPISGPNAGVTGNVEVLLTDIQPRYFSAIFIDGSIQLGTRAVASVMRSASN